MWERVLVLVWRVCVRPLCPSDISPTSGGNRAAVPPLWMDVPSAEAPAFGGMTMVVRGKFTLTLKPPLNLALYGSFAKLGIGVVRRQNRRRVPVCPTSLVSRLRGNDESGVRG